MVSARHLFAQPSAWFAYQPRREWCPGCLAIAGAMAAGPRGTVPKPVRPRAKPLHLVAGLGRGFPQAGGVWTTSNGAPDVPEHLHGPILIAVHLEGSPELSPGFFAVIVERETHTPPPLFGSSRAEFREAFKVPCDHNAETLQSR